MDYDKQAILKECRELLTLINCEVINNVSERTLFNILFESDVKKETLLKWLLQQFFSNDTCSSNSLENLVSAFVPGQHFKSFITGTMPVENQFKYWKLILSTLARIKKANLGEPKSSLVDDYFRDTSSLYANFPDFRNMASEFNGKYNNLLSGKSKKISAKDLLTEIENVKSLLSENSSSPGERSITEDPNGVDETMMRVYKNVGASFERYMNAVSESESNLSKKTNKDYVFHQKDLDKNLLHVVKNNLQTLEETVGTFEKIVKGVENIKPIDERESSFNDSVVKF